MPGTEYDPVDQLLGVLVHSNSVAGAILKKYAYAYDKAGNRLGETIQVGSISSSSKASYNNLNQLISLSAGGPVRFAGRINETGSVQVAGSPAVMSLSTNFIAYSTLAAGTNAIQITAKDLAANTAVTNYQIVVTNSGVAETFTYDLNGNQISVVTACSTNTYNWDAVDRLVKITHLPTNAPALTSEFSYDGGGRRSRIVQKTNGVVQSDPETGESLHPDLNHPQPIGPHWDYVDPRGGQWRISPDGSTITPK